MNDESPILHAESCLDLSKLLTVMFRDGSYPFIQPFILVARRELGGDYFPEHMPLWLEVSRQPGAHAITEMSPHQTLASYLQLPQRQIYINGRRHTIPVARAVDHRGTLAFLSLGGEDWIWTIVPETVL